MPTMGLWYCTVKLRISSDLASGPMKGVMLEQCGTHVAVAKVYVHLFYSAQSNILLNRILIALQSAQKI